MELDLFHNWVALRALFIFAVATVSLVLVAIFAGIKAWRERGRGSRAAQATISNRVPRNAPTSVRSSQGIFPTDSTSSAKS